MYCSLTKYGHYHWKFKKTLSFRKELLKFQFTSMLKKDITPNENYFNITKRVNYHTT